MHLGRRGTAGAGRSRRARVGFTGRKHADPHQLSRRALGGMRRSPAKLSCRRKLKRQQGLPPGRSGGFVFPGPHAACAL
jgi:hypothetical protein